MTARERLDQLFTYLRFASISTDPAYAPQVRACADFLVPLTGVAVFLPKVSTAERGPVDRQP